MGLYPRPLKEYLPAYGLPRGPLTEAYAVDPANGAVGAPGNSFAGPLLSVDAALTKCTANRNDAVLMVQGPTAYNPAAAMAWNKNYTHLIGLSGDLPGMGQRCRIVGTAGNDLAQIMTVSADGCIFKNLQFFQGGDLATDLGAVLVSGNRNYFKNVFFAGGGHATPAADAGMYSLKVTGSENYFEDCTIGLDTIIRAAANAEAIISGARNHFRRCRFLSYSETAGKFLVKIDASGGDLRYTTFEDCEFVNYSVNWAAGITNAFSVVAGNTHFINLKGNNLFVGVNMTVADVNTHIYGAGAQPNAGMFIGTNPS